MLGASQRLPRRDGLSNGAKRPASTARAIVRGRRRGKLLLDRFLIASFHRAIHVHDTSIVGDLGPTETQNRGFIMVVADSVGGLPSAGEGSAEAVKVMRRFRPRPEQSGSSRAG